MKNSLHPGKENLWFSNITLHWWVVALSSLLFLSNILIVSRDCQWFYSLYNFFLFPNFSKMWRNASTSTFLSMNMSSLFPSEERLNSGTIIAYEGLVVGYYLSAMRPSLPVILLMAQLKPIAASALLDLVLGNRVSHRSLNEQDLLMMLFEKTSGGCEKIRIMQEENLNWDEDKTVFSVNPTRKLRS